MTKRKASKRLEQIVNRRRNGIGPETYEKTSKFTCDEVNTN